MDKESLKKNQFWYLLGGFGLVWLILWVCSLASGSDLGEKNRKEQPEKKKSLADWNNKKPKNEKFIKPWDEYRQKFAAQKNTVWTTAWETQVRTTFYVWPNNRPDGTDFNQVMVYAADTKKSLPDDLRMREEYQRTYTKQFKDLDKLVAPAFFSGDDKTTAASGPSRSDGNSKGSGFEVIMGPTMATITGGNQQGPGGRGQQGAGANNSAEEGVSYKTVLAPRDGGPPTPEEIWILQEDFWVKQEMLHIVRAVQQSVGHFAKVDVEKDEAKPAGVQPNALVKRFSNGVWEFTFYIEPSKDASLPVISAKSTIKNIAPSHSVQPLSAAHGSKPLAFYLTQGAVRYQLLVTGEPLPWHVAYPIGQRAPDNLKLDQDFNLEQDFDWSNAPVRRIDALRTAKQSHRTAKKPLDPNEIFKSVAAASGSSPSPASAAPNPAPGPGGPGALNAGAALNVTPYLLERNRYIMSTSQARHLPIAMVLVVEPTHINDVLIAVANSPLRIQTTQVAFHQETVTRPPDPEAEKAPLTGPGPGPRPMSTTGQASAKEEDTDTNLVKLTVYGIATLYERPKKEEPKKDEPKPTNPQPKPPAPPVSKPAPSKP